MRADADGGAAWFERSGGHGFAGGKRAVELAADFREFIYHVDFSASRVRCEADRIEPDAHTEG